MSLSHTFEVPESSSAVAAEAEDDVPELPTITVSTAADSSSPTRQSLRRSKRKRKGKEPDPPDAPAADEPPESSSAAAAMSSRSSKHYSESGAKKHSSSSSSKAKSKCDDWSEVTEPEERRRIQNRIAQRKFREKAKEQKERAEREMRNQEHAGSSYHTPSADEIAAFDEDLSGLPWGSLSMGHVFAKGHESASRSGSRRDDAGDAAFDSQYLAPTSAYGGAADYGSTSASGSWDGRDAPIDDHYYGSSPYYMDFEQGADDYNYSSHR